jgi:dTDP-4-dehydrorhamnose 3,5-epimerase-like enzyme
VDRWYCVAGAAKVGIWDAEAMSGQTIILSADTPQLLTIPAGLFHGFTPCHGHREAVILNLPNREYDAVNPDEDRRGAFAFPFWWDVESR